MVKWSKNGSENGPVTWREISKYIEIRVILLTNATNRKYKLCVDRRFPVRSTWNSQNKKVLSCQSIFQWIPEQNHWIVQSLESPDPEIAGTNFQKSNYCTSKNLGVECTGLNVLAQNRRNWQINFIDSGLEVAKTRFQTFLWGKSVLFKWKCQIREFHAHAMERGEVLQRYCGWPKEATLLKQTPKDRTFIHAAGALQQNTWKSVEVSKNNSRKIC